MNSDVLLWDLAETARQLGGVSRRSVYRRIEAGDIETRKVGRRKLVVAASVRRYLGLDDFETAVDNGARVRGAGIQREVEPWHEERNATKTESIGGRTRRFGGQHGRTKAADQLAGLLGVASTKTPGD